MDVFDLKDSFFHQKLCALWCRSGMRLYHSRQIPSESGASILRKWYSLNHTYTIMNTASMNMMIILSLSLSLSLPSSNSSYATFSSSAMKCSAGPNAKSVCTSNKALIRRVERLRKNHDIISNPICRHILCLQPSNQKREKSTAADVDGGYPLDRSIVT